MILLCAECRGSLRRCTQKVWENETGIPWHNFQVPYESEKVVEGFKKNEEQLKHYVAEYKTKLKNQDQVVGF